jgi:branched-chain amino acid transport system substrate-binding protein
MKDRYTRLTVTRRTVLSGIAATSAASVVMAPSIRANAQVREIQMAFIAPLSGPWARQGELMKKGADMAVEDVNAAGGIKLPGGMARLRLVVADAGESAEKAKNAAQRLLSENPNLVAGTGAWLSSFTLAVTEVTERAKLPWITLSLADSITDRGFKYIFQTSATVGVMSKMTLDLVLDLAKSAGAPAPKTAGFIADNTPQPTGFLRPLRETLLKERGIELVVDEIFTPPLADATPLVQRIRSRRPDIVFLIPTGTSDVKLLIEKFKEFKLDRGRVPLISNGAQFGTPEVLKLVGKELLEGLMFTPANWGAKGNADLVARFRKRANEPWMPQDSISTYGDMWILKAAIEKAESADRDAVATALRQLDLTGDVGKLYTGGRVKFDEKGRRVGANVYMVQWRDGVPQVVFPQKDAQVQPIWPSRT